MPLGTSASKVIYFLSDSGSLWILKWLFGFDRSGRSRKKLRSSNGDALVCQPHMPSIFTAMRCYVSFPKIQSAMKFAQSSTWQIKTWQTCKVKIGAWAKLALSSKYTNWTWETNLKSQADAPCRPAALPSSRSKHPWRHPLRHRAARRPSRIQPDHRHFHRGRPDPTGIWKKTEPDRPAVLQPNGSTNGLITDLSKKKSKKNIHLCTSKVNSNSPRLFSSNPLESPDLRRLKGVLVLGGHLLRMLGQDGLQRLGGLRLAMADLSCFWEQNDFYWYYYTSAYIYYIYTCIYWHWHMYVCM